MARVGSSPTPGTGVSFPENRHVGLPLPRTNFAGPPTSILVTCRSVHHTAGLGGGHGGETRWDRICLPQPIPQKDGDNPRPARSENACCAPSRFFVFGLDCTGLRLDHAFKNWVNPVEVGLQVGAGRFGCHFHGDAAEVQVDVRVQAEQEMVKHEGTPSRRGLERAGPCSGQVDS